MPDSFAIGKVLAWDKIDAIMPERSKFGAAFTAEVIEQLKQWGGVEPVKPMELPTNWPAKRC